MYKVNIWANLRENNPNSDRLFLYQTLLTESKDVILHLHFCNVILNKQNPKWYIRLNNSGLLITIMEI